MSNVISLGMLITTAALLAWSGARAWGAKNGFLKWGGAGLAALLTAGVSLTVALTVAGLVKLHSRNAPVPALEVAGTFEQIQRGQSIASSFCDACHSRTGTFTGGVDIANDIPIPIGSLVSSNLTPAGPLRRWSDGEVFRAIRNGVDADGHWLIVMSYTNAGKLSDDDIRALIAYIRSRSPAGEATVNPPDQLNPLGVIMLGAGLLPTGKPVFTGTVTAPPKSATVEYGEYILSYQDCRECHGANLAGGVQGQLAPIGPSLNVVNGWTLGEFVATMRTGVDPGGHELSNQMPWQPIGKLDDEELGAVYAYLTHRSGS